MANIENNLGNIIVLSKAKYQELVNNNQLVLGNLYYIKDDLDQTPTAGSDNLITSGGVAAALQDAINSLDVSDAAVNGQFVYSVSETNGKITVSRRAIQDSDGVVLKTGDQTISGVKTFSNKPVFNDGATVNGDLSVTGDLYVAGTQHIVDVETLESQSNLFVANSNNSDLSALGGAGFIARVGDSQDPSKAYAVAYYDVTDDSVKLGEGTYSKSEYTVVNNQFIIDGVTYTIGTLSDGNGTINPGNIEVTNFIFELNDATYEIHRNNDGTYKSVVSQSFTLTDGQAIATRTNLVDGNIPQWDEANSTLIDSGKKVSDFVLKTATIAGIDLQDDITKQELADALGVSPDLNIENGTGTYSLVQKSAEGEENTATYEGAIALGKNNEALNNRAFVGGSTNIGAGHTSFTYGQLITNRGGLSTAFGKEHILAPDPSISENDVIPQENFVVGRHNIVYASSNNGVGNFIAGLNNVAKGSYGTVFGSDNYIPANKYISLSNEDYVGAFIAGAFADADKNNLLFAIGNGDYDTDSHAEQRQNALEVYYNGQVKVKSSPVDDDDVLRFGDVNLTNGSGSYSIKQKTGISYPNVVTSDYSIALGRNNTITGSAFSLVLGSDNIIQITDSGNYNTVIGTDNEITGEAGRVTLIGEGLKNTSWWQTVVGRYNKVDTYSSADERPLFLVGNGTGDNTRSNAFEVTRDGIARAYGTPVGNNDLTPKSYVDSGLSTKINTSTIDASFFDSLY